MTPRERMITAMCGGKPDRVPLDIWATGEVWAKLQAHFGTDDTGQIKRELHCEGLVNVGPRYVGPPIPTHEGGVTEDYWGMRYAPLQYETGTYAEQVHYPLAFADTVDDLDGLEFA